MNRAEGLVRRNKSRADNGNAEANSSTSNGGVDETDVIINERGDDDIEDNDSKETRLTLMEEVLLLGLKDKEVGHRIHRGMSFVRDLFFFFFLGKCRWMSRERCPSTDYQ